jgi:hypothetical protein
MERPELNAFILSHVFWPNFREEKLKLPDFIQRLHNNNYLHVLSHCIFYRWYEYHSCFSELDQYCEAYHQLKGMRTLEWKLNLGQVQVKIVDYLTETDKIDHLRLSWNLLIVKCPILCLQWEQSLSITFKSKVILYYILRLQIYWLEESHKYILPGRHRA